MMADHGGRHAVLLDQLQGLRIVACRDLDLVPSCAQAIDERAEDERMGARRHIDPHAHYRAPLVVGGSHPAEPGFAAA